MNKIKTWISKIQKKPQPQTKIIKSFKINDRQVQITPISYNEMLDVIFLILPYLKLIRVIKQEHESIMDPGLFFDVIESMVNQLNRRDLTKILVILIKQDEQFCSTLTHKELIMMLPTLIMENDFIDTMQLLKGLGVFE